MTRPEVIAAPLSVKLLLVSSLRPDPKNARVHTPKHVAQIAKSIGAFGFACPLLIDVHRNVIAGHGRLLAVQSLGWTEVPTIALEHLTPTQVRALKLADNKLTDCSSWDDQLLAEQLKELSDVDLDFDIEATGFDLPEIDLRILSLETLNDESELEPINEDVPVVSQLGDVWLLGPHRIVCGDALDADTYTTLLDGRSAAMVFCDWPFNVPITGHVCGNGRIQHEEFAMASGEMTVAQFTGFLSQALVNIKHACDPGSLLYLCGDWRHVDEISAAAKANDLALKNIIIWNKGTGGMGSFYRSQYEMIFLYKTGDAKHTNNVQLGRYGRNRTNVWNYPGVNSFARNAEEGNLLASHPTPKPSALVADAILDASERGACVLDPFLGSGTTVIAAEKTGRIGLGIELNPKYVDVAIRRWQRLTGQQATHAGTQQTYEQLAQERSLSGVRVPSPDTEGASA